MTDQIEATAPAIPVTAAVPDGEDISPPSAQDGGAALFAWLRRMRDERPVWRDRFGVWHVFRYDDVLRTLSDPATFSSELSRLAPESDPLTREIMSVVDPPLHRKLRRLVSQAFTPRTASQLEPRIVEVAHQLLDARDEDEFDLVEAFAYPLPVIVIAELLGVPTSDRPLFKSWSDRMLAKHFDDLAAMQFDAPEDEEYNRLVKEPMREMREYLREHCRDRRAHPRDDLMTRLVQAELDGDRLTDSQVVDFGCLLLMAGHVSTTLTLGNAVLCLEDNSRLLDTLHRDRSLIPACIEEVLRYRTPLAFLARVSTTEVEIAGTVVPENVMVTPWLLSANHDERRFAEPERFDPHRDNRQQLAFGHGIHFCLGAPLTRLEGRIALDAMLDHFADFRVTPGAQVSYHREGLFGAKRIPLTVRRR